MEHENDMPVSKELNVDQRLSSKNKSIPIGCIENTENKKKNFSRCNVEKSLNLLIMMMDNSTTFQEEQIQHKIMERLDNELFLIYRPHGQSVLTSKYGLKKWLEISTYID